MAVVAAPQQKKQQNLKAGTRLQGCPDTSGVPMKPGATRPQASFSVDPIDWHSYPPYAPVDRGIDFGMTGLTTYSNSNGIAFIDPRTKTISPIMLNEYNYDIDPETGYAYGGPLGSEGGGRFDLVLNRAGTLAAISNFGDSTVYFVNLASGTPVVDGKVQIDFFAEDMAFDPTGTWLLVTDGGFSSRVARIHVPTRTWIPAATRDDDDDPLTPEIPCSWQFPTELVDHDDNPLTPDVEQFVGQAQSIDISSDGRTVVCADYWNGAAQILLLDPATGNLSYRQTVKLWREGTDGTGAWPFLYRVVNSTISPDGRTVLLANATDSGVYPNQMDEEDPTQYREGCNVAVLRIDSPGHATRMPDVILPWEVHGGQSIVFSRDGSRAFYETSTWPIDWVAEEFNGEAAYSSVQVLAINGPGQVSRITEMPMQTERGTSQLFGVDTMATSPDGEALYTTNPTISGGKPIIEVFDLNRLVSVKQITCPLDYPDPLAPGNPMPFLIPTGIAFPEGPIDLGLQIVLGRTQADVNEEFTFQLVVSNPSVGIACGIKVGALLPDGVTLVSASPDSGSWNPDTMIWALNELDRRRQATLTVTAKATTRGGKLLSGRIKNQAGYDPRTGNNTAEATIQILLPADLALTTLPTSDTFLTQTPFTLNLTARNLGPHDGGQVTVTRSLPAGWSVTGATPSLGSFDTTTGIWTLGALANGASATLQLELQGTSEATAVLIFTIGDTLTGDPVTGNNQAAVTITLVKAAPPQQVTLTRVENDLVFSKEYVNQLGWQHNPINTSFTGYRLRRKAKGAADSSYALLADLGTTATQYVDRQLQSSDLFTYKLTTVNSRGEESLPVIVGN